MAPKNGNAFRLGVCMKTLRCALRRSERKHSFCATGRELRYGLPRGLRDTMAMGTALWRGTGMKGMKPFETSENATVAWVLSAVGSSAESQ